MAVRVEKQDYTRMTLLLLTGAVAAVLFVLLARPVFEGGIYTRDDLANHALPIRHFYAEALQHGDSFLWWPGIFDGVYIHGEGQAGMCHPLHLLLYRFLPLDLAFNAEFMLNYVWVFAGSYLMLRRLVVAPRHAALLGAVVFTFSGFCLQRFVHINAMSVVSHIPWLLWANHVLLTSRNRRVLIWAPAAVALLTGSQFLLGYPQYVWYSIMAEVALALVCMRWWRGWTRPVMLIGAKLLGLAIGMAQLLPTLDALKHSVRQDPSLDFKLAFSLHPLNILQFWSPLLFPGEHFAVADPRGSDGNSYEMRLYAGALCTVAVAWLFVRWKSLRRWRGPALTALLFSAMVFWLATGKYGWIQRLVVSLPVVGVFRCPTRQIVLVHLGLAITATIAFADLTRLARRGRRVEMVRMWPMAVPLLLSVATAALAWWLLRFGDPEWRLDLTNARVALFGTALIGAATAVFVLTARGFTLMAYAAPLLVAFEVAWMGLAGQVWLAAPGDQPTKSISQIAASVPRPSQVVDGRLGFGEFFLPCNAFTLSGYRLTQGYMGLEPGKQLDWDETTFRLGQVGLSYKNGFWSKVSDPMPRVRLLTRVTEREDAAPAVRLIDVKTTAVVDRAVAVDEGPPGEAAITSDRPGAIDIKTRAPGRQLLVLSESYHEGWRATVDGTVTDVARAYGDYMGVPVGGGTHKVSLRFEPGSFTNGLRLTLVGLALTLLWPAAGWLALKKS
ncbi:MAG: YfhO family protein [Planctomycetes bacterium]|nr:YfhO family protein [Planctomycetota bacterium]